jgi:cell wall-associated NlpC family hydrolase
MSRRSLSSSAASGVALLLLVCPVAALGGLGAVAAGLAGLPADATRSAAATRDIPADLLPRYQQAAARCPGLPWPVLAGIGKVESDHNRPPDQVSPAGAEGPMQFLPTTWTEYGTDSNGDGTADPFDPADALAAAADYLCAHNARADLVTAVASYACGAVPACLDQAQGPGGYATRVLAWAARYTDPASRSGSAGAPGVAGTVAVQVALAQVGTAYRWGGDTPSAGFDCSGLVQFAYHQAGVDLPRTAQTQYDAGPLLPAGVDPGAGDLVFFGDDLRHIHHVGLALGQGRMVDAPHTGAVVRVEPLAGFGHYLGATRPSATVSPR